MMTDTIAAIATAMSSSGIGIVRVSGKDAVDIVSNIFYMGKGKVLTDQPSHTIHYGYIVDNGEKVDEVMVLLMRAPRSYTREDTVEIDCHGGIYVMRRILETVIKKGARLAEPGEFTKRAFLNGRIDLSQAESVMDLIQAKNEFALKNSVSQLSGQLSEEIRMIRGTILHEIAFIESALDDPEHITLEDYPPRLRATVEDSIKKINVLLRESENGRILKDGINTVIVGKPNVGKSSLLNTLLGEERAIVTNIAGTTRDTLEEQINLDGIVLNVTDTAGIHVTEDTVEKIGIEKAKLSLEKADLIIHVVDASVPLDEEDASIMGLSTYGSQEKKTIILLNKSDLNAVTTENDIVSMAERIGSDPKVLLVSAKYHTGMDGLSDTIKEFFFQGDISLHNDIFITNIRHKTALQETLHALQFVLQSIDDGMPEDFYSIDLMRAYAELGSILGEEVGDDLVNEIFSKFCMGK